MIFTEEQAQKIIDLLSELQVNLRDVTEAGLKLEARVRALETAGRPSTPKCEHYWIQSLGENRTIINRCQKCGFTEYLKQP